MFPVLNETADDKTSAPDSKNCSEVIDKREIMNSLLKCFLLEVLEWWQGEEIGRGKQDQEVAHGSCPNSSLSQTFTTTIYIDL